MTHLFVVQITRQSRLIEHGNTLTWDRQVFPIRDPAVLEDTWREWAIHETVKRMACLAYCHDQAHRIYFSLPPLLTPEDFAPCLPCDDELWAAKTPFEWSQLLFCPSPYGGIEQRIHGVPIMDAFAAVGLEGPNMTATSTASPEPPKELSAVSPFGHYILLQYLLGELFRRCTGAELPAANPAGEEVNEHVLAMQLALHRWLQMWSKTPNAYPNENPPDGAEPGKKPTTRFMADPLPFYWLAQLLLLAFQEGLPPFHQREASAACTVDLSNTLRLNDPSLFAPPSLASSPFSSSLFSSSPFWCGTFDSGLPPVLSHTPPPAFWSPSAPPPPVDTLGTVAPDAQQFRLIKRWLHYIRLFLRQNQGTPTIVWDELMKIRLCGWMGDGDASSSGTHQQHGDAFKKGGSDDSGSWFEEDGLIGFFEEKLHI